MGQKYREYRYKAKPTKFNGITFRSKLEARYAIFMTALGLDYDYEPKYFDLGSGVYYMPDFFVDSIPFSFLEIKPTKPTKMEVEKCRRVSALDYNVAILAGDPEPDKIKVYLYSEGTQVEPDYPEDFSYRCKSGSIPLKTCRQLYRLATVFNTTNFETAFLAASHRRF